MDALREACGRVAAQARHVRIVESRMRPYAQELAPAVAARLSAAPDAEAHLVGGPLEERAAFWLTLDAINFGSGWFPTLRKRPGRSGYFTVAIGIRERFAAEGPWRSCELRTLDGPAVATVLGQDARHPLMELYASSLRDLGRHVEDELGGRFATVAGGEEPLGAVAVANRLGGWACFTDVSHYGGIEIPFLKRAQIAAADLATAGVYAPDDLDRLTMFADNLVPHVLRLDGMLCYDPALVGRIDRGELLEHGSPEEVEIRACALHAVERIAAEVPGVTAAQIDNTLWYRGQQPRYKAHPRHRCRCTAY